VGNRRYVVVTRALSGVRIREGEELRVNAQSPVGPALITFRMSTRSGSRGQAHVARAHLTIGSALQLGN
jgi:hypothetical protein